MQGSLIIKKNILLLLVCAFTVLVAPLLPVAADDDPVAPAYSSPDREIMVVNPLFGWDRNELIVPGRNGQVSTIRDTGAEYGLFALYANSRVDANNFFFYCEANGADVSGDIFFLNVYGPREDRVTWNIGAGYTWQEVDMMPLERVRIYAPMGKVGLLLRFPEWHLSLNPYVAPEREDITTLHGDTSDDYMLYGLTAKWNWRMLQATIKYYCQDDLHSSESFNTIQGRLYVFINEHWSVIGRFERMEHSVTTDTSYLIGPAFAF
jgi:hypothetical protein